MTAPLSGAATGLPENAAAAAAMLAEGRAFMQRAPWMIAFPGVALALLVLTVLLLTAFFLLTRTRE